jgi:hypothetical protein
MDNKIIKSLAKEVVVDRWDLLHISWNPFNMGPSMSHNLL